MSERLPVRLTDAEIDLYAKTLIAILFGVEPNEQ